MRLLLFLFFIPVCHAGMKVTDIIPTLPVCPQSYFTDNARAVHPDSIKILNERLATYDKELTDQIVVCIEKQLPEGAKLESYSKELFNYWGIGQKGKNNGVLILVFTENHKIRITVGSGLEKILPDDICQRIILEDMVPDCRRGDFGRALDKGISAVIQCLNMKLL